MVKKTHPKQVKISKIEITSDKMSARGGIFFFLRYIENIRFYQLFEKQFSFLKGSKKGLSTIQFIKQLFAYFIDGTDMTMTGFDRRRQEAGYAALLENTPAQMASSHQIKRFFRKFIHVDNRLFRIILLQLFIQRLHVEQPDVIILFGDTVVFDNNEADKREGVEPTYKRKKGYKPLQISWGPFVVDALFRPGDLHCNHGRDFAKAVARLVHAIRKRYRDVPIILLTDGAFLDDFNFRFFEERLKINFVCVGKLYDDIKKYVKELSVENFKLYNQSWNYVELGNRLKSWNNFRRCIFTTHETEENGQLNFEFARPDTVLYTNIGQNKELTEKLIQAGGDEYLQPEKIIELNHRRGKSELVHRSEKDFATKEQFPFEKMGMNRAYYYFMIIAHFFYETYKRDVTHDILPLVSYPTTFRRQVIDFAAKVVSTGGEIILKVTQTVYEKLNIQEIWQRSGAPQTYFVT
jgi:hypothetical protein